MTVLVTEAVFVCVSEHLLFHEALIRACKDKEDAGLRKEPAASNLKRGDEACIALCGIEVFIEDKYKMCVFRLLGNECKCSIPSAERPRVFWDRKVAIDASREVSKVQRIALYLCCEDKCRPVFGKLFREGSLADTAPSIEDDHLKAAFCIEPFELGKPLLTPDKHEAFLVL